MLEGIQYSVRLKTGCRVLMEYARKMIDGYFVKVWNVMARLALAQLRESNSMAMTDSTQYAVIIYRQEVTIDSQQEVIIADP